MQNSFDREDLQAPLAEINMTPLVDVMLVLLVIFLITAPMPGLRSLVLSPSTLGSLIFRVLL